MDDAARALIRKGAEEKLSKDAIRRELISQGFGTAGFDDAYQAILKELDLHEPIAAPSAPLRQGMQGAETYAPSLPGVIGVLREGVGGAVRGWKTLALAAAIMGIWGVAYVSFLVLPAVRNVLPGGVFTTIAAVLPLVHLLVSVILGGAVVYAMTSAERSGLRRSLSWSFSHFFSVLWIVLLALFIGIGGFVAFVLPGLLLLILNAFALLAFVREQKKGFAAFIRSYDLVRPHFLAVLGRLLALIAAALCGYLLIKLLANAALFLPRGGILAFALTVFGEYFLIGFVLSALTPLYTSLAASHPLFDYTKYRLMRGLYIAAAIIGLLAFVAYIALSGFLYLANYQYQYSLSAQTPLELSTSTPSAGGGSGFSFADLLTQSKVEGTAASARIYGSNMGSYEGVCNDITVVDPIVCSASNDAYAIYAPLQDGGAYCADSSGYSGVIDGPVRGSSCQ